MELDKFRDVHPDWNLIENLSPDEAPATINLLLAALFLKANLGDEELQALAETWQRLPFVGPDFGGSTFLGHLVKTHDDLLAITEDPTLLQGFLRDAAERITNEDKRLAVLRLLALVVAEDGLKPRQQEYFYATAAYFDVDMALAEDLLRVAWDSYERDKADVDHPKPLIKGKRWSEKTTFKTSQNPFAQPLQ